MIYRSGLLAAILCVQLLVVAGLVYFDAMQTADEQGETFLSFAVDSVDKMVISSADEQVTLSKSSSGWVVAGPVSADEGSADEVSVDDVSADEEKITSVLQKLAELRLGWPVATSADTQERFEVADRNFQRRVELYQGETKLAGMYLGSSPGYRRVHARNGESDDIYSLDFSTFEVPTTADDWLDKTLLGASGTISEITRAGLWTLSKADSGWTLIDGLSDTTGEADQQAADELAERLSNLRVFGIAASGADGGDGETLTVMDSTGAHEMRFWHDEEAEEYVVASNRATARYTVASFIAEQILLTVRDLSAESAGDLDAEEVAAGDMPELLE